jgi:hypothetical protein
VSKPNPFRLASGGPVAGPSIVFTPFAPSSTAVPPPAPRVEREPAPKREKRPTLSLEDIRVLLYLSTSPRITTRHRDACRRAAELLR